MKCFYYDANCLIKLVIEEDKSLKIREHFYKSGNFAFTTIFCFYEALSVLKTKWTKKNRPDSINTQDYHAACELLCKYVHDEQIKLEEIKFGGQMFYKATEKLSKKYGIDLSDSFQLVALKGGMVSQVSFAPMLITEDTNLRKAATCEGLSVVSISELKNV